jgi:CheY-like chemotaxis protein
MAERNLLCIEPDSATVAEIRSALSAYGFGVESIPNGDDAIEWGRANPTSLIILSVEPRKVGYAICNKLKRSPSLRDVPLILISSEETLATFEQHKKLKAHADEYLLKPLDLAELLAKVDKLVRLGEKQDADEIHEADSGDIIISDDDMGDGVLVDGGEDVPPTVVIAAEDLPVAPEPEPRSDTSEEHVIDHHQAEAAFQGETFDPETQAAFAALEAGSSEGGAPAHGGGDMVDLRSLWSEDDLPPSLGWERPPQSNVSSIEPDAYRSGNTLGPEPFPTPGPAEALSNPPPAVEVVMSGDVALVSDADFSEETIDVPPSPEEIEYDATLHEEPRLTAPAREDDGRVRELETRGLELQSRIESLENERQTLRKELEESRERFNQSATFSKEREFLALREIINKKEKDILDLRDDLDAKERQVLDNKDKVRELERARRDLEEKTLGFERSLVAANEKIAELSGDREKSAEREKGLKARLDDAHEEIHKSRDEADGLRRRLNLEEARGRGELERLRSELEARITEAEDAHRLETGRLKDEQNAMAAAGDGLRQAELARIEAAHRLEVETLQRRLADEQASGNERLGAEVLRLRREHEKAIASNKEEQAAQLASERQAYEALTEAKERDHRNEILGMRRRHEEELASAEDRRQRDIAEQEARRVTELELAEGRRRAELQARDEEQHARVTEIERRHLTEKTELSERHRGEYDQALGRAARAEGELAARIQEVEQAYRRLAGFEADLDAARAELGDREVRLAQTRDRIAELESKVADYEDQIVRAYQRLRTDEKTTEKARRALAVALALMDERASAPSAVAPSMKSAPAAVSEDANLKT